MDKPAKKRKTSRPEYVFEDNENSLLNIIRQRNTSLKKAIMEWINNYQTDQMSAVLEILQLIMDYSGCKVKLTQRRIEHLDEYIVEELSESFNEDSSTYPLILKGQDWKYLQEKFCQFIMKVISHCQHSIIYDEYLITKLINFLKELSSSSFRPFRHTATLAALKVLTSLVSIAADLFKNLQRTKQQCREAVEDSIDRSSVHLQNLNQKLKMQQAKMEQLNEMLTSIFESIIKHRCRDIVPGIRAICVQEIGIWMKRFPDYFLEDKYLHYIVLNMYAPEAVLRVKCLMSIHELFESATRRDKLENFSKKFKDQFLKMTLDEDDNVSVSAINILCYMLRYYKDILTKMDCSKVNKLVFSEHSHIAKAAGRFLTVQLLESGMHTSFMSRGGEKNSNENASPMNSLIEFFIHSQYPELAAYLVDSVIDSYSTIKDWKSMTDLLEEVGSRQQLYQIEETVLIEFMVCSIRQVISGKPPLGRVNIKAPLQKEMQWSREFLTNHFISLLPRLLYKYKSHHNEVKNLLCIPQFFNLQRYNTPYQKQHMDTLLKMIEDIIEIHVDTGVLEACSKTLEVLCTEGYFFTVHCRKVQHRILHNIANNCKDTIIKFNRDIEELGNISEDAEFILSTSLNKLSAFYSCHNMCPWKMWDLVFKLIQDAVSGDRKYSEMIIGHCLSVCYFEMMWQAKAIENAGKNKGPESVQQIICERLQIFTDVLTKILLGSPNHLFQEKTYQIICDLLVMFMDQIEPMAEHVDRLTEILYKYLQDNVFCYPQGAYPYRMIEGRILLTSFCKLILYNVASVDYADDIFRLYVKFNKEFGSIIKAIIQNQMECDRKNTAKIMLRSLILEFQDIMKRNKNGQINVKSEDFISLKALARRFSYFLGPNVLKNTQCMTNIHGNGILFAARGYNKQQRNVPPKNILFFEILTMLTKNFSKDDAPNVIRFLDENILPSQWEIGKEEWRPLVLYRKSLLRASVQRRTTASST